MLYSTLHKLRISHWLGKKFLTDRFIGFRLVHMLISKINFSVRIKRNGANQRILILEGMGFTNLLPDYEKWLDDILPQLIQKENPVILDVGANTGQTLLKIKSIFPNSWYLGIEPNPHCITYLKRLIELNLFQFTNLAECALSDEVEDIALQVRYKDDLLATTSPGFRQFTNYHRSFPVRAIPGDQLIERHELDHIDLIKIDVEGGESKALMGLRTSINRFRPLILCEILPLNSKSTAVASFRLNAAKQILAICRQLDYDIHNIFDGRKIRQTSCISDSLESSNYLFSPEEVHLPDFLLSGDKKSQ